MRISDWSSDVCSSDLDDSPFFLQFRNEAAKTLYIDDVALIGAGAAGSAPLHLTTPYGEDDLARLKWAQSADVMYVTHPNFPPYKLGRLGNTTWSFTEVAFEDGPYRSEEHTSELQSLMRNSYAVFCLK